MIGIISDMGEQFKRALWRMFRMRGVPRRPEAWEDPGTTRAATAPRLTALVEQNAEQNVLPKA